MTLGKSKGHFLSQSFSFAGTNKLSGKSIYDKSTIHYSAAYRQSTIHLQCIDKTLFTLQYPWQVFQKLRLLSAKANCNYQKQTTSCPDSRHLLLQKQICNYAFSYIKGITNQLNMQAFRAASLRERKKEREFSYSPSLSSNCILFSAKLQFQVLHKSFPVSLQIFPINFKCSACLDPTVYGIRACSCFTVTLFIVFYCALLLAIYSQRL